MVLLIYSELSNRRKIKYIKKIKETIKNKYGDFDVFVVGENKLNSVYLNKYSHIICAGGDGSISLLFEEVIKQNYLNKISYFPIGTANDFARNHHISRNIKSSLKEFDGNKKYTFKIGTISSFPLLYAAAFGKVSGVAYKASLQTKKSASKIAYLLYGLRELFSRKTYDIEIEYEGKKIKYKTPLILILNTCSLGGFKINNTKCEPYDVIIFKNDFQNGALGIFKLFLFGYKKKNTMYYDYYQLSNFKIYLKNDEDICVDGEKRILKVIDINANEYEISLFK